MSAETTSNALLKQAAESAKSGAFDDARSNLLALLEGDPDHELATGMLAAINAELGNFAEAATCFERALRINPDNPLARFQLALMRLRLQQWQAALDALDYGLDKNQFGVSEYAVHFCRAKALLELQQLDAARAAASRSRSLMPVDHALYPQLIELMMRLERQG